MPPRNATGAEWAAINSPTILPHASITSVSCKRSRNPRRCINFGTNSAGDCQRSPRIVLSGSARHSAITAARREGDMVMRRALIFPPHVTWQNIQLAAVFGHGASRDRDTALAQNLNDLVIAQRLIAILALHQI